MLRMILPKGTSFEFLTQWDVNLIVNHINCTPREILSERTPYEVALETLGEDILKAFQLKPIEPGFRATISALSACCGLHCQRIL